LALHALILLYNNESWFHNFCRNSLASNTDDELSVMTKNTKLYSLVSSEGTAGVTAWGTWCQRKSPRPQFLCPNSL